MILLLDIGNTRAKWAWLAAGKLGDMGAVAHQDHALPGALIPAFEGAKPERVLVCNVAGPLLGKAVADLCRERFGLVPEFFVASADRCGVRNGYRDPARLGADRWAAVIGAFRHYGGPVCVVDAGTAITVDLVDQRGVHQGGLIAPGPQTMRRALAGATAGLPDEGEGELALLARDTRSAITSGGWQAAAGFLERIFRLLTHEMDADTRFVLTGGDAERLLKLVPPHFMHRPYLVLEGLAVVARERTP